jgi:hypothetical protein
VGYVAYRAEMRWLVASYAYGLVYAHAYVCMDVVPVLEKDWSLFISLRISIKTRG